MSNYLWLLSEMVTWSIVGVGLFLMVLVGYPLVLALLAWFAPRTTALHKLRPSTRFVLLVPAHNEETLLPMLLANLRTLDYPQALYAIHVVADNCSDGTAAVARAAGAIVHERVDRVAVGKGHALQWLISRLQKARTQYDAAVILDADTVIAPNFLTVMDAQLAQGARVIQAYYTVQNPERSWLTRLRTAALALIHFVRPLGRMVIGGSVGLKGNGMVFHHSVLAKHQWSGSVTEDIDYHMAMVMTGERVLFAADAIVRAEMPGTLQSAYSQNVRWEQGRLQLARTYIPQLLQEAGRQMWQRNWQSVIVCLDSIMEHLIPPSTVLFGATVLYLGVAWLLASPLLWTIAAFLLLGQCAYVVSGLLLARTPLATYLSLAYLPFFFAWKSLLYGRILVGNLLGREAQGWVRTARDEV